jgi:hypothetical protein
MIRFAPAFTAGYALKPIRRKRDDRLSGNLSKKADKEKYKQASHGMELKDKM